MRDPKATQLKAAEAQLRSLPDDGITIATGADAILREWPSYTVGQRRQVLRVLFSRRHCSSCS